MLREHLRARYEWELQAISRYSRAQAEGGLAEALRHTQLEYESIIRRYCAPEVLQWIGNKSYGSPPEVNPDATRFDEPQRRDRGWTVTTHEIVDPDVGEQTFVYDIDSAAGRLVLADRRTQDSDGRWIRRLL
jgi:hypothetical protein